jgi:hypothetical protein
MEKIKQWLRNQSNLNPSLSKNKKRGYMKRAIPKDSLEKLRKMFKRYDTGLKGCNLIS